MTKYFYFLCPVLLLTASLAYSQKADSLSGISATTKNANKKNTPAFKIGVSYLSNSVFMGRTDTARTPSILPEIKYSLPFGLYFSASLDFIPNRATKKLDGGDLAAGYDFDIGQNLSGSTSFTKTFYSSTSTQVTSAVRGILNGNLTYDIGTIISPSLSVDYDIDKQGVNNDVFVTPGVSHDFIFVGIFGRHDILLISPTATVNFGTQNFYELYLTQRKFKNTRLNAAETALFDRYYSNLSQFKLLDFEFSAPLEYKSGYFIFQFTPTYAIAQNQLPAALARQLSNKSSIFYFEAGVAIKL